MTCQIQKQSNCFLSTGLGIIMFHFNAFDYTLTAIKRIKLWSIFSFLCSICRLLFVFLFCFFFFWLLCFPNFNLQIVITLFVFSKSSSYLPICNIWVLDGNSYHYIEQADQTSVNLIQVLPTLMTRCPWAI